jgi:hypothetical protein
MFRVLYLTNTEVLHCLGCKSVEVFPWNLHVHGAISFIFILELSSSLKTRVSRELDHLVDKGHLCWIVSFTHRRSGENDLLLSEQIDVLLVSNVLV